MMSGLTHRSLHVDLLVLALGPGHRRLRRVALDGTGEHVDYQELGERQGGLLVGRTGPADCARVLLGGLQRLDHGRELAPGRLVVVPRAHTIRKTLGYFEPRYPDRVGHRPAQESLGRLDVLAVPHDP